MATSATESKIESKIDLAKAEAAAEKAYATAAAKVEAAPVVAAKVEAPLAKAVAAPAKPVAAKLVPVAKKVAAPKAKAKPAAKVKPAAKAKPAAKVAVKAAPVKSIAAKKIVKQATKPVAAKTSTISQLKDTIMTTTKTTTEDFTAKLQDVAADAQGRAKAVFEKGQALFGEAGEFTKGNVEALVESGKILAAGLQDMGKDYVAEGKTALEVVQADIKQLAAVKSPTDFFKLQGEILRRNFDAAVATGSKNSEKVVKLAGDAFAPLSTRVSLAVEKVKQAA
jgi:phasin family protein